MRRVRLSRAEARRIALAAQGFDRPRPSIRPDIRHFRRVIDTLGLLQLDYVNVLMPAQFLVLWSRLGPYDRQRFERCVYDRGEFTEQWAHEADAVVSIGSSLSVYPAAYIPLEIASRGEVFIIINNSPTDLDSLASLRLDGMAGTVFPQLVNAITA